MSQGRANDELISTFGSLVRLGHTDESVSLAMPLGAKLGSFASAAESVAETLEVERTTQRVERLTERIGCERVAQRELAIADWEALPLVAKLAAPQGIKAPAVAGVSCDGGRMQRCDLPEPWGHRPQGGPARCLPLPPPPTLVKSSPTR